MRIRIALDLDNKRIPVKYSSILQGIIYYGLYNNGETTMLHDQGQKIGKRHFKLFTFSEIYGKTTYDVEKKELLFHSSGCFDFTAFNDNLVFTFVTFIEQNTTLVFGNQLIKVLSYTILDDDFIDCEKNIFYTVSPVTAYFTDENKKTIYLDPLKEEFSNYIINNMNQKYFLIYHENMPEVLIKEISNIKGKRIYYRNTFIIAYHMTIEFINLNSKVKRMILTCGIGSKNSLGFGMISSRID